MLPESLSNAPFELVIARLRGAMVFNKHRKVMYCQAYPMKLSDTNFKSGRILKTILSLSQRLFILIIKKLSRLY